MYLEHNIIILNLKLGRFTRLIKPVLRLLRWSILLFFPEWKGPLLSLSFFKLLFWMKKPPTFIHQPFGRFVALDKQDFLSRIFFTKVKCGPLDWVSLTPLTNCILFNLSPHRFRATQALLGGNTETPTRGSGLSPRRRHLPGVRALPEGPRGRPWPPRGAQRYGEGARPPRLEEEAVRRWRLRSWQWRRAGGRVTAPV